MPDKDLNELIKNFLAEHSTVVLASASNDVPWAAAVFYAEDGFDLYFFSSPDSRHSQDFAENSHAAATVNGHYWQWREIKGLQMEGVVTKVTSKIAKANAMALYLKKFPFVKEFFDNPLDVSRAVADKVGGVEFYCFSPSEIHFINNESGFGNRESFKPKNS